jgi:3-methyladenine DNA glycosylase AlkD
VGAVPELPLVAAIRAQLSARADPGRAVVAQAYMKSTMPFLGVRVPEVRAVVRAAVRADPPEGVEQVGEAAAQLWRPAVHREERYAATALTGLSLARGRLELLALHQEMITTGAWWDHVDEVAHRVGDCLLARPDVVRPLVVAWSTDVDLWLRRTAIICQLFAKQRTDVNLLAAVIEPNLVDREFFIRKAIGWALRQHARTDPDWVRSFVASHELSPLSRREALKHL